jgi:hypothetical protein
MAKTVPMAVALARAVAVEYRFEEQRAGAVSLSSAVRGLREIFESVPDRSASLRGEAVVVSAVEMSIFGLSRWNSRPLFWQLSSAIETEARRRRAK